MKASAPGKVNLFLGCGDVRADGYHELVTIFQAVSLRETVEITAGRPQVINAGGRYGHLTPLDTSNLAWRAVELVAQEIDVVPEVEVSITKEVPVAGGMAGGSADAAAALVAANAFFAADLSQQRLHELAAQLGADVPFCLHGSTALGRGRGDELTSLIQRGEYTWAFVMSHRGLSTPEVFQTWDRLRLDGRATSSLDYSAVAQALAAGDQQALAQAMSNDLQAAACSLRPELRTIMRIGHQAGALRAMVSGSGPTVAFLCENDATAREVIGAVTSETSGTFGITAGGPVPGAQLEN
ncbi:4-(cytidine 5'-diphospho)-2-C-methyl-D-erythritol kinase [Corynebacterium tapiri]|uniref:4-diphosphocytidyl-2-C-methyl-D-erythritol kinase n=1 Tax=Corynebacterium tapiri TaxID=1448266 RepID=A0A5C4U757_9CORY|nr:4-(cytidine 5'-diphospho)-2-C-methyl-D-erythritol kinase [Corynebacterium tapiri]TNM00448.1 4-(cytidine 5'-diphospho)-2-C-methyl-D-erythritol kinase [Corynebacterium tapiri]